MKDVVAYAADRGIRVVPEFDMPGHMTAWFVGHPELASGPGPYQIDRKWGVSHPAMNPTVETTYRFLDRFIGEMVTLFPDKSWHIGGDEVEPTEWKANPAIQAWMKSNKVADAHALQTYFNSRLFALLKKHGREPVGWDEILTPDLPAGAVIQSWRGTNYLVTAAKQGRQAILSAPYYLDHIKTTTEMYLADPLPAGHDLTPAQQALVLGGEACMWGEYVTSETIDSRLWPRLAGVAERFWSPASVRDVPDMYRRLEVFSRRLEEVGPVHESHTARMIRRFAAPQDAATLESLLEYSRPRGFAGRGTNQFSPLTRLIDAARPDPWNGWRMQALAEGAVRGDARAGQQLAEHFRSMQGFAAPLEAMVERTPDGDGRHHDGPRPQHPRHDRARSARLPDARRPADGRRGSPASTRRSRRSRGRRSGCCDRWGPRRCDVSLRQSPRSRKLRGSLHSPLLRGQPMFRRAPVRVLASCAVAMRCRCGNRPRSA